MKKIVLYLVVMPTPDGKENVFPFTSDAAADTFMEHMSHDNDPKQVSL